MSHGLGPRPSAFYLERQLTTRSPTPPAAPSGLDSNHAAGQHDPGVATPGDGLVLGNINAITVSIYPASGQTLSGGGNLRCWIFNRYQNVWTRCSDLDLALSGATSAPAYTWAALAVVNRNGMLINWLTDAVTISGGPDVLVRLDGFTEVTRVNA